MKNKKIVYLTLLLFFVLVKSGISQGVSYKGTSSANFLKINLSAKIAGIAESDITYAEDASCLFYNPAGISRLQNASASFSYTGWLVETSLAYFAVTIPFQFGTAGFDVSYFSSGDIEETTLLRQDGTGRIVRASDVAIGLSFAKNLTDRFSVGFKIKYIQENLASVSSSAFAFDIGSIFETSILNDLKIGISLSNFGSSMEFNGNDLLITHTVPGSPTNKQVPGVLQTGEWDLPLFFKIGTGIKVVEADNFKVLAAYTLTDSRDFGARHNVGSEIEILDMLRLRGGYRFNYDEATFSAGAGVKINSSSMGDLFFDYAFTDFGDLKSVNQISLSINF
jgi:hypothetical protein